MFGRMLSKELLHSFQDLRFMATAATVALLAALGTFVGVENYAQQLGEYNSVSGRNAETIDARLEGRSMFSLASYGYKWNRPPEVLSPVVYGLSGKLGQEVLIRQRRGIQFEGSRFATDPIHAQFGVLDFAFVAEIVLSLAVMLFTYDAVCGEKQAGTLRLYTSFPVSRSAISLAKLLGATVSVMVPCLLAFLLTALIMSVWPTIMLSMQDWIRLAAIFAIFGLYLSTFAAFGLFMSSLTTRPLTAFLYLLGLWAFWVFVVPNLAVEAAEKLIQPVSVYDVEERVTRLRGEVESERQRELDEYWSRNPAPDWNTLPVERRRELRLGRSLVEQKWDRVFFERMSAIHQESLNGRRQERRIAELLGSISPLVAARQVTTDLARTGAIQQELIEDRLSVYIRYFSAYVVEKDTYEWEDRDMSDFERFEAPSDETVAGCLARNTRLILTLLLFPVLGYCGAFVAMLRYDVR